MSKFLSIETTNTGTVLFPLGDGCLANVSSPDALAMTNGVLTIFFAGTNMSQSLIDSINSAQVHAYQTSWTQAVSVVSIPFGTTIDSVSFEGGAPGGPGGPVGPTCDYQITVSPSAANPVEIVYYLGGTPVVATVAIGDSTILNGTDCIPQPVINPTQSPAPNPANVTIVELGSLVAGPIPSPSLP